MTTPATLATTRARSTTTRGRRLLAAVTGLLAVGALVACGPATSPNPSAAPGAPATNAITLTTVDGKQVTVPASTPTALLFFSYSCGECVGGGKSLAQAQAAAQKTNSSVGFLAVDMDPKESPQDIAAFLEQIDGQNLPAATDQGATLSRTYQVSALTTVIVVDPAGKVTYRGHAPSSDQITAALNEAAGK